MQSSGWDVVIRCGVVTPGATDGAVVTKMKIPFYKLIVYFLITQCFSLKSFDMMVVHCKYIFLPSSQATTSMKIMSAGTSGVPSAFLIVSETTSEL